MYLNSKHQSKLADKDETLAATVDLTDWLIRCQKADIQTIPATFCPYKAAANPILEGNYEELESINR